MDFMYAMVLLGAPIIGWAIGGFISEFALVPYLEKLDEKKSLASPPGDYLLEEFAILEKNWIENDPVQQWLAFATEERSIQKIPAMPLNARIQQDHWFEYTTQNWYKVIPTRKYLQPIDHQTPVTCVCNKCTRCYMRSQKRKKSLPKVVHGYLNEAEEAYYFYISSTGAYVRVCGDS